MSALHHRQQSGWIVHCIAAAVIIAMCTGSARSQQSRRPSIIVQVLDQQGGAIAGARAGLTDAAGQEKSGFTNQEGKVVFSDLSLGDYAVRITAEHFKTFENKRIQVASGPDINLSVTLR